MQKILVEFLKIPETTLLKVRNVNFNYFHVLQSVKQSRTRDGVGVVNN